MDGPSAQGFVSLTGPLGRGFWIALRAMLIKSALRDDLAVSYGKISILVVENHTTAPAARGRTVFPRAKPGCEGFTQNGAEGAHHNPQRQSRCQTLEPSGR